MRLNGKRALAGRNPNDMVATPCSVLAWENIGDSQEKPLTWVTWANLTSICSKVMARFAIAVRFYSSEKKFSASFLRIFYLFKASNISSCCLN